MSALGDKVNGYVSAMESAESSTNDDKSTFHGEAFMREVFTVKTGSYIHEDYPDEDRAREAADFYGGKLLLRTVSVSQWVEVDE